MREVFGDQMGEVWGFLHRSLYDALKPITLSEVFLQHVDNSVFLLAHHSIQDGHFVLDVCKLSKLAVESRWSNRVGVIDV